MPRERLGGNRNDHSWPMRLCVLLTQASIRFKDTRLWLSIRLRSALIFKRMVFAVSPVSKVPALQDDGIAVRDS